MIPKPRSSKLRDRVEAEMQRLRAHVREHEADMQQEVDIMKQKNLRLENALIRVTTTIELFMSDAGRIAADPSASKAAVSPTDLIAKWRSDFESLLRGEGEAE
jgi:hypothetical protein